MVDRLDEHVQHLLQQKAVSDNLRQLSAPLPIDFSSNDYLGLAREALTLSEAPSGSGSSRLIYGNHSALEVTEEFLAGHYGSREAILFHSGYHANLALFSALGTAGVTIFYDEFIHASIRDGLFLGRARSRSFRHNDSNYLEAQLLKTEGPTVVVTEGLFSMDGDFGALADLFELKKKYHFSLIVDEAHTTGWIGAHHRGAADGVQFNDVDVRIHTFGKAMGGSGACIATLIPLRSLLANVSRPFIYTTAPSPQFCSEVEALHHRASSADKQRSALHNVLQIFNSLTASNPLIGGDHHSPIRYFQAHDIHSLNQTAQLLASAGIDARLIRQPSVPAGQERIRICLHAFNTEKELRALVNCL
ncbi:MAG: hypothetical protein RL226_1128 [Bacteroidota bacterium]